MTSGQGQSGGADKRRFTRLPLNLDGLISIDGQAPVPCTARDFCTGGMFISADPAAYASVSPQTPAVLYFALFIGGEKQDFQVNLLVARAVAKGIGVSFSEPNEKTLELLNQLAAAAAPSPLPDSTAALSATQEGFAPEFITVVGPLTELVLELVLEHVGKICDRFVESSDESLFLAARDAGNNVDETRFLDGQREMRDRQDDIRAEVPPKIETGISIIGNPLSDDDKESASGGLSDLTLVEKDDFEEFLVVSEMVSELEPEYSEPLYALGQRFTFLANREVELSSIPIGPSVLCNAIAESLKSLQSDRGVTKRIFGVMHEVMRSDLANFYDAVNALFVEQGIVPKIEKDKPVLKKKKKKKKVASTIEGAQVDATGQPDAVAEDDYADLMPGPDNYPGHPQVAPAAPYGPAPQVQPAHPQVPAGYTQGQPVQAAPPSAPMSGGVVQAAPPAMPQGFAPVPAAPPSVPVGGGVQAAPPSVPVGGGVQAAPPSVPVGGGVQAAPPSVPVGGGVQAAPPSVPVGGGVQAVPPSVPMGGGVQAAPPSVPSDVTAAPAAALAQGGVVAPAGGYVGHGGTLPPGDG